VYTPATVPDASQATSASPTEATAIRPDPGLARGVWETKPVVFYGLGVAVVLVGLVYAASRLGLLRRRKGSGRA